MNTILNISATFLLMILINACGEKKTDLNLNNENSKQIFTTPEEAAQKGKSDLLILLKNDKDLKLNIDVAKFENSKQGNFIRWNEIDFRKLINTDSVNSLSQINGEEKYTIAPFISENQFSGTVEIVKDKEGWKVSGLGNSSIISDLNEISRTIGIETGSLDITVYEVPNLQINIYQVNDTAGSLYFLNYENFRLTEGVRINNLYPVLKGKAVAFQKEFGDLVKKQKLLK